MTAGDMPIKFTWFLNGNLIENGRNNINVAIVGKRTSFLNIDSLSETHAGNYTCLAQNNAGLSSVYSELIIKGFHYLM